MENKTIMLQTSTSIYEAGAVTIRYVKGQPEVLLIYSKKQPRVRIFPKGHIEMGESARNAAARELLEEAGADGEYLRDLDTVSYEFRGKHYHVEYFLFEFREQKHGGEDGREPVWCSPTEAEKLLAFAGLRDVLKKAFSGNA
jgi:ADP-ribose pyrophosphatase YjhB (NUDIX family)